MNRVSRAIIALLFIGIGIALPRAGAFASLSPQVVISLANADRAAAGLPALSENATLDSAAQMKALDMALKGYYAHTTPEGYLPFYWFQKVGYSYLDVGENLDLIYSGDEATVNTAWMNSPEHRDNILLPQFTEVGVGIATGQYRGSEGTFVVELFGTPMPPPVPIVAKVTALAPAVVPVATVAAPVSVPAAPQASPSIAVAAQPASVPADASTPFTPGWAIFATQYSPERFVYALQIFIISLRESTRQLLIQLSAGGVY